MKRLLSSQGEYFFRSFYGKKKTKFTIIGTRMAKSNHKNPLLAIDTFISEKGKKVELIRSEIVEQVNLGKMLPVEDSEIKTSTRSQTEYNKIASSKT